MPRLDLTFPPQAPCSTALDALRGSLFDALPERQLLLLAEFAVREDYKGGAHIIHPGKETSSVYLLAAGEARLYRQADTGREITVLPLSPGEVFGAIFTPGTAADAVDRSTVYLLPQEHVEQALVANRELASAMRIFLRSNQILMDRLESVALRGARALLASFLLDREAANPGQVVMATHEEMAAWAGTRADHVSKLITELDREALIRTRPRRRGIAILDREDLRRCAE